MAITNMDGIVAGLATSQDVPLFWANVATVAGGLYNLNRIPGNAHGSAAIATSRAAGGHIPTDVPPGYASIVDPAAGKSLYIARIALVGGSPGNVAVYDRVYAASGFLGTATGAQLIATPPALPANRAPNNGDGLEIWLESNTAIGSTTTNVTVQYTNSAGVTGRNTVAESTIASFPINRMQRLRLQDGDTGVQSIQSVSLVASTGAAGDFSVLLLERKCMLPITLANVGTVMDFADLGLPKIQSDSALQFINQANLGVTGAMFGSMNIIQG